MGLLFYWRPILSERFSAREGSEEKAETILNGSEGSEYRGVSDSSIVPEGASLRMGLLFYLETHPERAILSERRI